ncbi:hypothetical protein C1H76_2658 [Elsinoe australis]|uniref:Uncharacterized protein n=1 Tax=Elsinoe australis TaxID=40998 RepID=A0A4V6DUU2_9PEZI|nr:hypothetical protein C1H76_2658 [Elsinoe australis]
MAEDVGISFSTNRAACVRFCANTKLSDIVIIDFKIAATIDLALFAGIDFAPSVLSRTSMIFRIFPDDAAGIISDDDGYDIDYTSIGFVLDHTPFGSTPDSTLSSSGPYHPTSSSIIDRTPSSRLHHIQLLPAYNSTPSDISSTSNRPATAPSSTDSPRSPFDDITSGDTASDDFPSDNTRSIDTACDGTSCDDTASDDFRSDNTISTDTACNDKVCDDTTCDDTICDDKTCELTHYYVTTYHVTFSDDFNADDTAFALNDITFARDHSLSLGLDVSLISEDMPHQMKVALTATISALLAIAAVMLQHRPGVTHLLTTIRTRVISTLTPPE